jgi:RNA polymerase sigma factor (sigma-70 family)
MIDDILIETVLKKKHWAFTIFYNEIVDHFFSYLKSNFRLTDFEINDIISNTFVKIWNKMDSFDQEKWNFVSWCWIILRNTTKDYFKKKKDFWFSDFEYLDENNTKTSLEEKIPDFEDMLENLNTDFQFENIKNAMEQLKYDEREVLYLRFTEQKSLNEIAQITWLSDSNVRVKLHRSLKKLKKKLNNDKKM